jgi:hypothetical protein
VASDVQQSMTKNVNSLGRQTHRQKDQVEVSERSKASEAQPTSTPVEQTEPEPSSQEKETSPSKEELFENLMGRMEATLGKKTSVELLEQARELACPEQLEPCLAVLAHSVAKSALQSKRPGDSKQQIRQAARRDPELAEMLHLADAAKSYLSAKEHPEDQKGDQSVNGYNLAPKKQADLMAKNHESMQKVQKIYAKMADAQRKHLQELNEIRRDTNRFLHERWLESRKKQSALQDKQFRTFIEILRGPTSTT